MSGDLQWVPQGEQETRFADDPIRMVHDDIIICKLRPGQVHFVESWVLMFGLIYPTRQSILHAFATKALERIMPSSRLSQPLPIACVLKSLSPSLSLMTMLTSWLKSVLWRCLILRILARAIVVLVLLILTTAQCAASASAILPGRKRFYCSAWRIIISVRLDSFHTSNASAHTIPVSIESTGALKPHEIFEEAVKEFLAKIQTIRSHLSKAASSSSGLGDRMNVATD